MALTPANQPDPWEPPECGICGALLGHAPNCADTARARVARLTAEVVNLRTQLRAIGDIILRESPS